MPSFVATSFPYIFSIFFSFSMLTWHFFFFGIWTSSSSNWWWTPEEVCVPQAPYWTTRGSVLHFVHSQYCAVRWQQPWDVNLEDDLWGASTWIQGKASSFLLLASGTSLQAGHCHTWQAILKWRVSTLPYRSHALNFEVANKTNMSQNWIQSTCYTLNPK